jgi:ABC-type nitrate/sulfonate/bicarbonate transport system substrate-binding protein
MSRTGMRVVNALLLTGLLAWAVGSSGCSKGPTVPVPYERGFVQPSFPMKAFDPQVAVQPLPEVPVPVPQFPVQVPTPAPAKLKVFDGPIPPKVDFKIDEVQVPFILWGGDVATFHANGGPITRGGTLFHKQGLRLKLDRGDDFSKQVKNYLEGKSPLLRGTMSMLGEVADQLGKAEHTRPVVFLQLTWSAGDHLVARSGIKMLGDLKGKKIALQKGGPHVGMLDDILRTAALKWSDIQPAWTDDVTGDKGPATLFRKDAGVDACFAITPDMTDLTGGLDKKGSGDKDSVKDAHVLVSTAHMSRSIADVYACRKDFYDAHKDWIEKFTAAYLKGCEELVGLRKQRTDKDVAETYKAILELTQEMYGKNDIKTLDDADGLIADAAFVGLPGNQSFFTDKGNLSGFRPKMLAALDVGVAMGANPGSPEFLAPNFDYDRIKNLGDLTGRPLPAERFRQDVKFLTQDTIYFFTISFQPDQSDFPEQQYGDSFQRALEQASLFGGAIVAVRGHADPSNLLKRFRDAGLSSGRLRQGAGPDEFILGDGSTLDLKNAKKVVELIKKDNFGDPKLQQMEQFLQALSERRAAAVRNSVVQFAKSRGVRLDTSQIRSVGVGSTDPVYALPDERHEDQFAANRRVEFRIIRVPPEAARADEGFDY